MAIKNIVAKGIGFTSDGTIWIPTHGFSGGISPSAITFGEWIGAHQVSERIDAHQVSERIDRHFAGAAP